MACQLLIFMSTCFHKDNILRVKIQRQPIVSQRTEQNVSDKGHAYHLSLFLININILDPCCFKYCDNLTLNCCVYYRAIFNYFI